MDKTIPHIGVLMVKENPIEYPNYQLPQGYTFIKYKPEFKDEWIKLQVLLEQFDTIEKAKNYFDEEFMSKREELSRKMIFIKDYNKNVIGTASLWNGNHFGETFQRIHWLAVHPEHQGKGIGKALVTKVLNIFQKFSYRNFIYLTTQTWSYKAINIYLEFGFEPYIEEKPKNWKGTIKEFNKEKELAWDIIFRKIKAYQSNK